MNVKRIVAKTSREAMRQLRETLGPDAVILSNRAVEGGVEVLALPAEDIAAMAPPVVEARVRAAEPRTPPAAARVEAESEPEPEVTIKRRLIERVAMPSEDSSQLAQSVISEIKTMQTRLESQLADLAWRDLPGRDPKCRCSVSASGISCSLSRTGTIPSNSVSDTTAGTTR